MHFGGEDTVVNNEKEMIKSNGHDVFLYLVSNVQINSFKKKLTTTSNVAYSIIQKKLFYKKLRQIKPDIVHVHNFFPILSPSIYDACIDFGVPVVQTLHNYRIICPGAFLLRKNKICELCVKGSVCNAILHRCYRNSFIASLSASWMVYYHRQKKTWTNKVDQFIALSTFSQKKFVEARFPADKIIVKPNFIKIKYNFHRMYVRKSNVLFIGRLSHEKGIETLLKAWKELTITLKIAGTGPFLKTIQDLNSKTIIPLGHINQKQVTIEMAKASFLIMPSEWYETFGLVIVEAFAHGLPVVASNIGGMSEIVENNITGLHFEPGNPKDLAEKVLWMHTHPDECKRMGENARKTYEQKYTPEKNYEMLMDIYQKTIENYEIKHS